MKADEKVERALRSAARDARSLVLLRDQHIRTLHARGYTLRALGEVAGLSHTAIGKIVARS